MVLESSQRPDRNSPNSEAFGSHTSESVGIQKVGRSQKQKQHQVSDVFRNRHQSEAGSSQKPDGMKGKDWKEGLEGRTGRKEERKALKEVLGGRKALKEEWKEGRKEGRG